MEAPPAARTGKLGDRASSDVTVRIRSGEGRDNVFYTHSAVIGSKCSYFASCLSRESKSCIELVCSESEFDHHVILLRLLYAKPGDSMVEMWHNVGNAVGVLKLASRLGCEDVVKSCVQYLESVPWEESEEEEILKSFPGLGSPVLPVLARLQPVDPEASRNVFLSALRAATAEVSSVSDSVKTSAQEQVEYMLVEDDDAPLVSADDVVKSELKACFSKLFKRFLNTLCATSGSGEYPPAEEAVLEKVSDLEWAWKMLARVNLLQQMAIDWAEASADIVKFLQSSKLRSVFWETKLKVVEIATRVIEAVGYGSAVLPGHHRTRLLKLWLPYVRCLKPLLEEGEMVSMGSELCSSIESAMTALLLSLPSEDQANIIAEWLKSDNTRFPDLSEAFEVWCFRTKAAKRRLAGGFDTDTPCSLDTDTD